MSKISSSLLLAAVAASVPAIAQQAPDAGQILQEQQRRTPELPRTAPGIDVQRPGTAPVTPGGAQVVIQSVSVGGASVFSEAALAALLDDAKGQSFDLAGLRGLADRISVHYRNSGYPFARAYVPAQPLTDGRLRIEVIEGRYGEIKAQGSAAEEAQEFLTPLKPGDVIESASLERTTLLLDDLPGFRTAPIIRPGQEIGTGDLNVQVSRERMFSGDAGVDNHGNRYTGEFRARLNLQFDSPFLFGDQIQVRSLVSDEGMWLGSLSYSLPIGASGLRGQVGYSQTAYELGKQFSNLDATGTAKIATLGLSYPLLRSQQANVTLGASWQYKQLEDKQGAAGSDDDKWSQSLPLTAQFDVRDGVLGGGVTYGLASWTPGQLHLDAGLLATDRTTAKSDGFFSKFNLDIARVQALPGNLVGYARVSAQWAADNLDSSEGFGLGGPSGVRAYPTGEGYGDEGWLAQFELRYTMGAFSPYVFHDTGRIRINHDTWDNSDNTRSISGSGLGVRYQQDQWQADASIAWRGHGGRAESDTEQRNPRAWVTVSYRF